MINRDFQLSVIHKLYYCYPIILDRLVKVLTFDQDDQNLSI